MNRQATRMSSHTQTFQILMQSQGLETLPEFKHLPVIKKPSQMHTRANIFAHILMNLFISGSEQEDDNFIAKIKKKPPNAQGFRLHINAKKLSFEEVDPQQIHTYFLANQAHNLGSLTLINLIFSGHLLPDDLFLSQSPKTGLYYFSQGFHDFWADYFDNYTDHVHIQSHHSMQDKYAFFIPGDMPWWDEVLPDYHVLTLKRLFLEDYFKSFLRISCTPWSLIEKISRVVFQGEEASEVARFLEYVRGRIAWVQQSFSSLLSLKEKSTFNQFKNARGNLELEKYIKDVHQYFIEVDIISEEDSRKEQFKIIGHGMRMQLPHLELYAHSQYAQAFPIPLKQVCFNYMLWCMETKAQQVLLNPEHIYWHQIEYLAEELSRAASETSIEVSLFFIHLFNKTIQFQKNHLGHFLLSRNPLFKNIGVRECLPEDPLREAIEHKTPLFMALYYQNLSMLSALKIQAAKMNADDIQSLQGLLIHLVIQRNEKHFDFILRHYSRILKIEGFQETLIKACDEHTPAMKRVIERLSEPRAASIRRQSFFIQAPTQEPMTIEALRSIFKMP